MARGKNMGGPLIGEPGGKMSRRPVRLGTTIYYRQREKICWMRPDREGLLRGVQTAALLRISF